MKSKKVVITIVLSIALVLSFTMLMSYAYWKVQKTQTGTNDVLGACLSIDLEENGDTGFTLNNAWPVTDQEGSSQTGYTFTVKNKCEDDVTYQVILDRLDNENSMNSNYVKVELDDRAIQRYGSLEDVELIAGVTASKKIYTGIIPKKENDLDGEVTHTIKLWISSDSPNEEIGKTFSSRVRVIAGQQIAPSNQLVLQKVLENGEVDATINNLSIGDLVQYKTEQFYVIGIDGNNLKLLSRYLLNVGEHPNPNGVEGLQYYELGYTRADVNDSNSVMKYKDETTYYGSVPFSASNYWYDSAHSVYVNPYSNNCFVYSDQASISNYVIEYVQKLQTIGLNVTSGTLLSFEDVSALCNTNVTGAIYGVSECPNYLFETQYWLGSNGGTNENSGMALICAVTTTNGSFYCENYSIDYVLGVRPVINLTLN